jgi:hypothetical protein
MAVRRLRDRGKIVVGTIRREEPGRKRGFTLFVFLHNSFPIAKEFTWPREAPIIAANPLLLVARGVLGWSGLSQFGSLERGMTRFLRSGPLIGTRRVG